MYRLLLIVVAGLSPAQSKGVVIPRRVKIGRKNITISKNIPSEDMKKIYFPSTIPTEQEIRQNLHLNKSNITVKPAKIARAKGFQKIDVSYGEILANLKTMQMWKQAQARIFAAKREGRPINISREKIECEKNIREMRVEIVKRMGTRTELKRELDAYRKFQNFYEKYAKTVERR